MHHLTQLLHNVYNCTSTTLWDGSAAQCQKNGQGCIINPAGNILKKISKKSCSCVEGTIMVFLNQILFKYYENLGICYILYYLDIHQKKLKSIQPVLLNPGALLLFVSRSMQLSKGWAEWPTKSHSGSKFSTITFCNTWQCCFYFLTKLLP